MVFLQNMSIVTEYVREHELPRGNDTIWDNVFRLPRMFCDKFSFCCQQLVYSVKKAKASALNPLNTTFVVEQDVVQDPIEDEVAPLNASRNLNESTPVEDEALEDAENLGVNETSDVLEPEV